MNFWLDVLPPILAALLIWWGSTGTIIYVCGRKAWRPWAFWVVTALQPLAFWRLWVEKDSTDVAGVFATFFWAIVVWSWIETSYYSGVVVGRRMPELEPDAPTGLRLRRAIAANLYHELGILALSVAIIIVGWGGRNDTGLWAFMILHWTHQSAKINIFLGVNNLTTDYLPDNLKYMAQYFTQKPLNTFFPFSATITTALATYLFSTVLDANTAGQQVAQALLFIMMAAAVLEHWWLVTPLPTRAWEWALKSRQNQPSAISHQPSAVPQIVSTSGDPVVIQNAKSKIQNPRIYIVCGYLGSGKTTLIQQLLPQLGGKVAVVVNDFGAVGVDAELIRAQGQAGAVLELPGGCICCTMQKNLSSQLVKLLDDYQPEQVLIEPSGVAGIEEIVRVLANPRLAGRLGPVEIIAVVDAPRLLSPTGFQKFTLTQLKVAAAIVVSKTDLVTPPQVAAVLQLVAGLNPQARLFGAVEGRVEAGQLFGLAPVSAPDPIEAEPDYEYNHHGEESGLISFAREYEEVFNPAALRTFFAQMAAGRFGPVERAKGIFKLPGEGRQVWDLAGGTVFQRLLPDTSEEGSSTRFMLVARDLATDELNKHLLDCIIPTSHQEIARQ